MPKITRLILHNTNRREWCGYASLLRPSVPSRVNTLTTVRLVPISRSLAPYSRTADVVCWHRRFEKLFVYKGTQKSASQKPQLELLTDAETCHNLHSLCLGENDCIRLSKALVLACRDRADFFVQFSPLWRKKRRTKKLTKKEPRDCLKVPTKTGLSARTQTRGRNGFVQPRIELGTIGV